MHGTFENRRESDDRIHRRPDIGFFALPALLVIALMGLALTYPGVSTLVSDAVQAEFAGIDSTPPAPTQFAQPAKGTRAVSAN